MTGEAHWIEPLFVILGGAGLFLAIWLGSRVELFRRKRREIICPVSGAHVHCTFVENTLTDEKTDVEACSAFVRQPPTCAKSCL